MITHNITTTITRYELPVGVQINPFVSLGSRVSLPPSLPLGVGVRVLPRPVGLELPPGLELVHIRTDKKTLLPFGLQVCVV